MTVSDRVLSADPVLPRGWALSTLGEIAELVGGGTPSRKVPEYFGGDIVWLTPTEIPRNKVSIVNDSAERITTLGLQRSSARIIPKGTVLMTSRASIGYIAIAGTEVTTNQGFASFICTQGIYNYYLAYWLLANAEDFKHRATGTTFKEISKAQLRTIQIPLAPKKEQHRIVEAIEALFSRLDAGMAALKRAQANLKRYKASVLKAACESRLVPQDPEDEPASELLARILAERRAKWEAEELAKYEAKGKKPPKNWRDKYPEPQPPDTSDLPDLPEGWVWVSIGQAFSVYVGSTPSRGKPEYWNGDIPWVSSGEVAFCRIKSTREQITQIGFENCSSEIHPVGTVLLGMIGEGKTRGQAAILDIPACHNQNSAAIRVSEVGVRPEFIFYYLEANYEQTRRRGSGGNQPALNKSRVEAMLFPLPPIAEQERIVQEIERLLSFYDDLGNVIARSLKRAERLRQSILSEAFAGRLVPQDPNDEPASILLERIRAEREQRR